MSQEIDKLCAMTTNPHVLSALHACRPGHPCGLDKPWKWRAAYASVKQEAPEFASADLSWLKAQANSEATQQGQNPMRLD